MPWQVVLVRFAVQMAQSHPPENRRHIFSFFAGARRAHASTLRPKKCVVINSIVPTLENALHAGERERAGGLKVEVHPL